MISRAGDAPLPDPVVPGGPLRRGIDIVICRRGLRRPSQARLGPTPVHRSRTCLHRQSTRRRHRDAGRRRSDIKLPDADVDRQRRGRRRSRP
ncbi:hypothetical protein AZA_63666 [Nitrospirillum viridazoti Y2]|nr:hypothetical protein AZA_63666 [Nitrospirillum amazonense Y2]